MKRQIAMLCSRLFTPAPLLRFPAPTAPCRRRGVPVPRGVRAAEDETPLSTIQELLGATGDDPGHWNFSPEWWGTQDGGWGRNPGEQVFAAQSEHGNGRVTVTAHPCSSQEAPPGSVQEWRVLRFNDVTRQSVAKVTISPCDQASGSSNSNSSSSSSSSSNSSSSSSASGAAAAPAWWSIAQQADCLAPPYLKTMASLAAALLGLQNLISLSGTRDGGGGSAGAVRVLCIGVGGGSLPLFLAHHFPQVLVDAVELDPAVVAAATQTMGLPTTLPNLRLHTADAVQFVADFVERQQQRRRQQQGDGGGGSSGVAGAGPWGQDEGLSHYDLVLLDAFDGDDNTPAALCTPEFAGLLSEALHPQHGSLVINAHSDEKPRTSLLPSFVLGYTGPTPSELGYDPERPQGRRILALAETFAAALRGGAGSGSGAGSGVGSGAAGEAAEGKGGTAQGVRVFTVSVVRQLNVEVVVARGLGLERERGEAVERVKAVAAYVAAEAGFRFPVSKRATQGFHEL